MTHAHISLLAVQDRPNLALAILLGQGALGHKAVRFDSTPQPHSIHFSGLPKTLDSLVEVVWAKLLYAGPIITISFPTR